VFLPTFCRFSFKLAFEFLTPQYLFVLLHSRGVKNSNANLKENRQKVGKNTGASQQTPAEIQLYLKYTLLRHWIPFVYL
jgi:hypothetical protein